MLEATPWPVWMQVIVLAMLVPGLIGCVASKEFRRDVGVQIVNTGKDVVAGLLALAVSMLFLPFCFLIDFFARLSKYRKAFGVKDLD